MERYGTIAYRNQNGNFQKRQQLREEEKKTEAAELSFFAKFIVTKYHDEITEEKRRNVYEKIHDHSVRNCADPYGDGADPSGRNWFEEIE